jgi:hypothetical protein
VLVSDLKPGMTAIFGTVECPITDVQPVTPIRTRIDFATPNGAGWLVLPNDAPAPAIREV